MQTLFVSHRRNQNHSKFQFRKCVVCGFMVTDSSKNIHPALHQYSRRKSVTQSAKTLSVGFLRKTIHALYLIYFIVFDFIGTCEQTVWNLLLHQYPLVKAIFSSWFSSRFYYSLWNSKIKMVYVFSLMIVFYWAVNAIFWGDLFAQPISCP